MIKIQTYKIFSTLLSYPNENLKIYINKMLETIEKENILFEEKINKIKKFTFYIKENNLLFLQEKYVSIFDRQKQLSLYLFEHIHGDSRERGMAMVDLKNLYEKSNFAMKSENELPDYIPVFLEYLSLISKEQASLLLGEIINIITTLKIRLKHIESHYYSIFSALESLSSIKPDKDFINKIKKNDVFLKSDKSNIDKNWEEPKVF